MTHRVFVGCWLRWRCTTVGAGFVKSRITPTQGVAISVQPNTLKISTRSGPTCNGVLGYAEEGGPVASMFEDFCTRNLCAESWDFIVAACRYEVKYTTHSAGVCATWNC